jgi:ABC-type multidrug transport system fused ATPase/permease subunit
MLVALFRDFWLFFGSLTASWKIHQRLMDSVTRAKFKFFDVTPLGQIMNRFSKDLEAVDQEVAPIAIGVMSCALAIVVTIALISAITPGFLVAGIVISAMYFFVGKFYLRSSRDLKRLESVQRSPLFQQFGETLSGITTIRAYGDERRFIRDNMLRINTHSRPFIYLWGANRWLAFRIDCIGDLVAFFAGAFVVMSIGKIDAGSAGLSLSYAISFTENVLWLVRLYAMNEQNMNSVERIKEYLDVEQEAEAVIESTRPAANWPSQGSVEFINYSTRYRPDLDPVLRDVSFKINPLEKVGIVGRTGAGKSSLALALFRGLEAEEGKILIDDVDIGLIGLQDLRESITIVPQDPTLFTGTIRTNLDPFNLFTDEDIFTALRRVQLIGAPFSTTNPSTPLTASRPATPGLRVNGIPDTPTGTSTPITNKNIFLNLSSTVTESGNNLSQGQRQLLCLARAMLKNPKVLMMDEATASIDYNTDSKIQETIRELKSTIITIAHRLQTIVDYDKVLVLDKGSVVEYGHPHELLKKEGKDAIFRGMCETSGDFDSLQKAAKKAWDATRLVDDE